VVRLDNIGKSYGAGADVLHDISLTLEAGDFCCVTGASGAGKTTLLNIVALAEQPSYGRLTLFGADALAADRDTRAALRRRIGIRDNIALPLRIAGIPEDKIRDHVDELATWLGIASQLESSPQTLSAGERQRVAIARAIVSRPDLLIADEPTAGRDDETALSLLRAFERLHSLGTTVLIATDNIALARRLECRHFHLEEGWLTSLDTAAIQ